ncbi:dTDP-4-dehydrorhamnose 3,5-epimerase [uncultured Eudoraea sp.]|uniref:dTDP-4-dehydrorhamnose 3,5-epimerase n=1 Tax=uncultured Eudoraea sp. TaxID=1035614 RepID=UPI00261B94BE|nr:dTDP-4-dehydrorhamnose 3,5-epimerase [uncultured Eudoraea sp.]
MEFRRLEIPEVVLCEPNIIGDDRGYFTETYRLDKLNEFLGYPIHFCQDNESMSSYGILRGLHYQLPPYAQTKLVRVLKGSVLDVAVDIRKGSPTFGQHVAVELSGENKKQLLIPRGFAHGFLVMSKEALFAYKVDNYYSRDWDRGIAYNDPALGIDWKLAENKVECSVKDSHLPLLKDVQYFEHNMNLYA